MKQTILNFVADTKAEYKRARVARAKRVLEQEMQSELVILPYWVGAATTALLVAFLIALIAYVGMWAHIAYLWLA